jgi:hypothetical protein
VAEPYLRQTNVGSQREVYTTHGGSYYFPNEPGKMSDPFKAVSSLSRVNSLTGVKNPMWRSEILRGVGATTQCSGLNFTFEDQFVTQGFSGDLGPPTHITQVFELYGRIGYAAPTTTDTPSASTVAAVSNRCIRKFLDSVESARSSVEAGQDLGEYKESIESMIHPMNSMKELITGYFSKLRKAKKQYGNNRISLIKALADSYLEFTFGWNPLAIDVANAYAGLQNRSRFSPTVPVSASASEQFAGVNQRQLGSGNLQTTKCNFRTQSRYTIRYKGAVKVRLEDGNVPVLDVLRLSTVRDFVVTAWDLLPYSFIVDYFVNVGDVISGVTFPFADLAWGNKTVRTETKWFYTMLDDSSVTAATFGFQKFLGRFTYGGNSKYSVTSFSRSALVPSDLVPRLRISIPVSSKPWENIAALLASSRKGLVPFF